MQLHFFYVIVIKSRVRHENTCFEGVLAVVHLFVEIVD
jgi:hypothetical protein